MSEHEELAQWLEGFARDVEADDYTVIYDHNRLHRAAALLREPAPAPGPTADGEREAFAQWLDRRGGMADLGVRDSYFRAAALLRQPAPASVPVPVAERPWERPGWCDAEGRCWIGTPETECPLGATGDFDLIYASWSLELPPSDPALQRMQLQHVVSHPHWAIPQPPQCGEAQ